MDSQLSVKTQKIIFLMLQKLVTPNVPPHKYLGLSREFKCANYAFYADQSFWFL